MRHTAMRINRGILCLLLVTALAGCGKVDRRYEADYSYEILKKSPELTVTVVEKGKVERATTGDGGGGKTPGLGRHATRVRSLSATSASIEVTLPGDKTTTLELSPQKPTEQFPAGSDYGIRMTLNEIRNR